MPARVPGMCIELSLRPLACNELRKGVPGTVEDSPFTTLGLSMLRLLSPRLPRSLAFLFLFPLPWLWLWVLGVCLNLSLRLSSPPSRRVFSLPPGSCPTPEHSEGAGPATWDPGGQNAVSRGCWGSDAMRTNDKAGELPEGLVELIPKIQHR